MPKKKICKSCGEEKYMWSRKYGCKECSMRSQNVTTSKPSQNVIPKRKPIKKVSDKQKKRNLEYLKVRMDYLNMHRNCQVCGAPATDIHHKFKRIGKAISDPNTFMAVCRGCHEWIHSNPEEATQKGYLATQEQKRKYYE